MGVTQSLARHIVAKIRTFTGILKPDYKVEESTSLEAEVKTLQGQEKAAFLALLRRMLQWRPENRASAHDLIRDPWLQVGKE